jgi:hypothetical protein
LNNEKSMSSFWTWAFAFCVGAFGLSATALANEFNIDFEGFSHGQIIDDEYDFVSISAENFRYNRDLATAFDTGINHAPPDMLLDLVAPFDEGPSVNSPGNILVIQAGGGGPCDASACKTSRDQGGSNPGMFHFDFSQPVDITSIDFFDIDPGEEGAPVVFFDKDGNEIGRYLTEMTTMDMGSPGDPARSWTRVIFDLAGVQRIDLALGGSGGIDNIQGKMAIPLPAVAFLFPSGLIAGLAWIRRRTRPFQATAA